MKKLSELRKKPYTSKEFFEIILKELKDTEKLPDILDYELAGREEVPIDSYEYTTFFKLAPGGNEGIYLDCYLKFGRNKKIVDLGTFKTLCESDDAMRTMAILEADFIIALNRFIEANMDDFTWSGYDMRGICPDGSYHACGWEFHGTKEEVLEKSRKELVAAVRKGYYSKILLRNNSIKEEKTYELNQDDELVECEMS